MMLFSFAMSFVERWRTENNAARLRLAISYSLLYQQ